MGCGLFCCGKKTRKLDAEVDQLRGAAAESPLSRWSALSSSPRSSSSVRGNERDSTIDGGDNTSPLLPSRPNNVGDNGDTLLAYKSRIDFLFQESKKNSQSNSGFMTSVFAVIEKMDMDSDHSAVLMTYAGTLCSQDRQNALG